MSIGQNLVDMHVHSTASDGQYTPTQLVHMAQNLGLTTIAITDHDTTAGLAEAKNAGKQFGVRVLLGAEFNTKHPNVDGSFHVLGYGINPIHPVLKDVCADFSAQRRERAERIFDYLKTLGVCPSPQRVYEIAGSGVIGRPHFARAMVEEHFVSNIQEAFARYLDTPEFQRLDRIKPHPKTAIEMITQAGGIAVLAHPSLLKLRERTLSSLVSELKDYGLGGIECYYSTFTPEQSQEYLALAEQFKLYSTGGSDFHGEVVKPDIKLGLGINNSLFVPPDLKILEVLRD